MEEKKDIKYQGSSNTLAHVEGSFFPVSPRFRIYYYHHHHHHKGRWVSSMAEHPILDWRSKDRFPSVAKICTDFFFLLTHLWNQSSWHQNVDSIIIIIIIIVTDLTETTEGRFRGLRVKAVFVFQHFQVRSGVQVYVNTVSQLSVSMDHGPGSEAQTNR